MFEDIAPELAVGGEVGGRELHVVGVYVALLDGLQKLVECMAVGIEP